MLAKFLQKFLRYDMNVLYLHVCVDGNVVTILGMDNSVLCTYLLHVRDIRKSAITLSSNIHQIPI